VQMAALAVLVRGAGLHYLLATVLAVELALLHNFFWHHQWTWRDRPCASAEETARRLGRFHLLNGAVSFAGNLGIVALLTGILHVDPLAANLAAILACSVVNFCASEVIVFKVARSAGLVAIVLIGPFLAPATMRASELLAELTAATVAAWQKYEQQVDERYERTAPEAAAFFAQDAFKTNPAWRDQVNAGQVTMARIPSAAPGLAEPSIPDGKVHHWVGAVFIPNATTEGVVRYLKDRAGRESEAFDDVIASKLIARDGDRVKVYMKIRRDSVITVTYNTEHDVVYRRISNSRASSRSVATKIAQLDEAGTPQERELPVGRDHGFLWRLDAYWRYEQAQNGVLIECESISLSRSVPLVLRPFVSGTVERIAKESLEKTLGSLRKELTGAGMRVRGSAAPAR
jgi:putative flippase GtrA